MNTNIDDIKHIRSMMERSTKFIAISGLAGIGAGILALIGAYLAHLILINKISLTDNTAVDLIIIGLSVLLGASFCGLFFSIRKAKKAGSKFWMPVTYDILKDFAIPMISGGLFCLLLIMHHVTDLIPAAMLIFYGIALINAGSKTHSDVKILGLSEIFLGLLAGIFSQYNIFIWAIGFGLLHIVYGIVIYLKHDNVSRKQL